MSAAQLAMGLQLVVVILLACLLARYVAKSHRAEERALRYLTACNVAERCLVGNVPVTNAVFWVKSHAEWGGPLDPAALKSTVSGPPHPMVDDHCEPLI